MPQLDALGILAQAGSKEFVEDVIVDLFRLRDAAGFSEPRRAELCDVLSVERSEVDLMFAAGKFVVRECVYGGQNPSAVLPPSFHPQLKQLLDKIVQPLLPEWQARTTASTISLPRLVDVDWRVDVKTSANTVSRMATPTALVQMQVARPSGQEGVVGKIDAVNFEASKETLQTMLDGLGKVREQLSAV